MTEFTCRACGAERPGEDVTIVTNVRTFEEFAVCKPDVELRCLSTARLGPAPSAGGRYTLRPGAPYVPGTWGSADRSR